MIILQIGRKFLMLMYCAQKTTTHLKSALSAQADLMTVMISAIQLDCNVLTDGMITTTKDVQLQGKSLDWKLLDA